jgi:hypothetical protein
MRRSRTLFPVALAVGLMILTPKSLADEPKKEIRTCQTISKAGSYVLVNNLTASGDCLVVTTDFVTIDLAGFSIVGPGTNVGTGILAGPPRSNIRLFGIAVRNGSISGFLTGVDLSSAIGSLVEGLRVVGGGDGVASAQTTSGGLVANGIVKGNTVSGGTIGNDVTGIVTGNYVTGSFLGIAVAAGSTVIGNTAAGSARFGFDVNCPSNVTDNTSVGNFAPINLVGEGCNNTNNVVPPGS